MFTEVEYWDAYTPKIFNFVCTFKKAPLEESQKLDLKVKKPQDKDDFKKKEYLRNKDDLNVEDSLNN